VSHPATGNAHEIASLDLLIGGGGLTVMMIALHKQARTTPAVRAEMAASSESSRALASRFGVTETTIYK
jgi:hypothetical protein